MFKWYRNKGGKAHLYAALSIPSEPGSWTGVCGCYGVLPASVDPSTLPLVEKGKIPHDACKRAVAFLAKHDLDRFARKSIFNYLVGWSNCQPPLISKYDLNRVLLIITSHISEDFPMAWEFTEAGHEWMGEQELKFKAADFQEFLAEQEKAWTSKK